MDIKKDFDPDDLPIEGEQSLDEFLVQEKMPEKKKTDGTDDFELPVQELSGALQAILFVSGESVSTDRLREITGIDKSLISKAMDKLISEYQSDPWGGLLIRKVEDSYIMCTKPSMKKVLERMFMPRMKAPLSQASYETLAIVAYNQPVTRAQVEAVRGVSSDSIISRLLDRGWIEEAGTLDAPGRPALFRTSEQFLLEFGINSIDDLPSMELMSYKTIRDLEQSLEEAAGSNDNRQISMDNLLSQKEENKEDKGEDEFPESDFDEK
ncbi:MAG: SMC-Scp complex subunit ScpB [Clostridiales bacterium]|nr:SMC-Scp complex subunit ScpB [Clostridiales bacterium]